VTIDRTAQIRRTGSLTIPWSLRAGEDLGLDLRTLALGGYAIVRRGLRYATDPPNTPRSARCESSRSTGTPSPRPRHWSSRTG
jgi:hypothetical protein